MAGKAVEKRRQAGVRTVDPRDEPSAEWGWHGEFPKASRIAGWFTVFGLLVMLIGNHENNTENVWLIGLAVGLAGLLLMDIRKQRLSWRR
ncbi:Protein of unknown function [Amycolatopsis arida]|uniref:DUF2631 domain-containing protein n=1 Tax=Amycolatopsis arida TaxID=587909 RepID=A0A1I5KJ94_9PSEU|nr:DUF2631 domain-containing protein [Amycolatopsis arida]TDX97075.1 uncharacterized protein DUF2631 [Amycolatopsis arida]SFO85140.1 Protein of unknown function [Amycolatopsis arida]